MHRRLFGNRILLALFAALILGFSMPRVSVAAQVPPAQAAESSEASAKTHASDVPADSVYSLFKPTGLPHADDRSEESRDYICAASGERTVRSISVRKLGFLLCPGIYEASLTSKEERTLPAGCRSFDDLVIIHYIHSQDGSKG